MTKENKDYGKSVKAKLLNLSKVEGLPYQSLLIRYVQERLLYRLAQSKYKHRFYLKGGALLYAHEQFKARPTLDIDFLGNSIANDKKIIEEAFSEICGITCEKDGIHFDTTTIETEEINENRIYKGIRLHVTARLDTARQKIAMDIGFGDIITPDPQELEYPLLLDDLPPVNIMAYSLETVVAEKFQAMIELSENNSRMKDFYDLYTLLYDKTMDDVLLEKAIHATLKNRGTVYEENHPLFRDDFSTNLQFQMLWKGFMKKIGKTEPDFETVIRLIKEKLFPFWEKYKGQ